MADNKQHDTRTARPPFPHFSTGCTHKTEKFSKRYSFLVIFCKKSGAPQGPAAISETQ